MKRIVEILTPENVFVEYELAGLGSRFVAYFIDTLIKTGLFVLLGIILVICGADIDGMGGGFLVAIILILFFIINNGYYIFFEMVMNGQSPGKRVARIKVLRRNGEPITFVDSVLRNILRIADFLPLFNLAGTLFLIFNRDYRRIGDYAANTVVVKVKAQEKAITLDRVIRSAYNNETEKELINIYPVNNFEYSVLKEFMARRDTLGGRTPVFEYHLNKYFQKKFNVQNAEANPYIFFKAILEMNSGV